MRIHHLNCGSVHPIGGALVCHVLLVETGNGLVLVDTGFGRTDVRHIVITHFDADHIGGLSDFPDAEGHTTAAEVLGAITAPTARSASASARRSWPTAPSSWSTPSGELWRGFAAAQELTDIAEGIALIALPGHTRGHAAVAVDRGDRWILHADDAFHHPRESHCRPTTEER